MIAKLLFGAVLLLGLFQAPLPLRAQGSVSLSVCNAGKVDVDVILSQRGKVSQSHIRPADCAPVALAAGAMESAYVGIALVDSRGQWGAAKRLDLLPALGDGVLSRANEKVPVPRGNSSVSLAIQLLFRPRVPTCTSPDLRYSEVANLPINATGAERAAAQRDDDSNRRNQQTVCDTLDYTLNVEGFADTDEITFKPECDPCDEKSEAQLTPEQRAARQREADSANQLIGTLSGLGPGAILRSALETEGPDAEQKRKARESRLSPTRRMDWSDLLTTLRKPGTKIWEKGIPRYLIIRGTVSGVEVSKDADEPIEWANIAFRESPITDVGPNRRPYSEFNVCTSDQGILRDVFGPDFLTSMIGKAIQVEGETQGAFCRGLSGSIRITLAHQVRPVKSVQFEPGSAPRFVPPPTQPVAPAPSSADIARAAAAGEELQNQLQKQSQKQTDCQSKFQLAHRGDVVPPGAYEGEMRSCMQAPDSSAGPGPALTQPAAAAPSKPSTAAPAASPDAARAKAEQEQQDRLARQAKQRNEEIQKAQKQVACVQQLQKAHPDGGRSDPEGFKKGYLACLQAQ